MRHPFDLDNFESFLSEQTERHRMYAGDRVWRNIFNHLHGNDKWPALTFASILTVAVISVILTITYPSRDLINMPGNSEALAFRSPEAPVDAGQADDGTIEMLAVHTPVRQAPSPLVVPLAKRNIPSVDPATKGSLADEITESTRTNDVTRIDDTTPDMREEITDASTAVSVEEPLLPQSPRRQELVPFTHNTISGRPEGEMVKMDEGKIERVHEQQDKLTLHSFVKNTMDIGPLPTNGIQAKKSRWSLQLYATPSISYRYWLDDKQSMDDPNANAGPLAPYMTNSVNEFISHKPKLGFEIGGAVLYDLAENFRVKAGLQVNYRQYGIAAYETNQPQPAMLSLNGNGNRPDPIVRYTNIGVQGGGRPIELTSNFLQLAVPVGFDLKMTQVGNVDLFVSASGQFTYQLTSSNFLISTDYKNYLRQTDLDRPFNINTAVEAFASFKAAGLTWQAGPQIRYQLLPGTKSAYPIKEHLIDYGMKVGVIKTIR